jgi:tripartite-type tricarboxylate transporter receptor subunit TctC
MKKLMICWAGALLAGSVSCAFAQSYPTRPIRMIVPFAAGGGTDVIARVIAPKLTQQLGQNVIIDNRTGASGNVGSEIAARAAPDGYTVIMGNVSSHAINASVFKLPYDPVKDFAPVSVVAIAANVLVVHPSFAAKSVQELITAARAAPGKIDYASAGNGSPAHLAGELFKVLARVEMNHVPYNGNAPAITALLGGQVALMFSAMPAAIPHARTGKLRALAVTSIKRVSGAPELPTIAESGLPGFDVTQWMGILAPAGTSRTIVDQIYKAVVAGVKQPDVIERYGTLGAEPLGNTPNDFAALVVSDVKRWSEVVRAAKLKID